MNRKVGTPATILLVLLLLVAAFGSRGYGQTLPASTLEIDLENFVQYLEDSSDLSRFATNPGVTPAAAPKNFNFQLQIGDIVAVNGQPAKGTFTRNFRQVSLTASPNPGQAIADTVRNAVVADTFEILKGDGTPIGTIVAYGTGGGAPPLGGPLSITQGNFAITGGTGAFLGARGQLGQAVTPQTVAARQASVTEDPANRRRNGGGRVRFVLQVIPLSAPQMLMTQTGPLITHADSTIVSASRPATAGETLSLFVTGLGPTRVAVDPGQPFPPSPLAEVNSTVQVTVNGRPADVLSAVGFPGQVDTYQVNVRVPPGIGGGTARLQVTAAWIAGPAVNIPVQ